MPYRVVQWATGPIGRVALRGAIDHPDMEVVGVFTYSDEKVGRDAGDLAHRTPIGVRATNDVDEIVATDADVVFHCARLHPTFEQHDDVVTRLLASGKNVISTTGYYYPPAHGPEYVATLEAACAKGGSSLLGTGLNPGFVADRLVLTLTGLCAHVERIEVREFFDCSDFNEPGMVYGTMGMGSEPDGFKTDSPVARMFGNLFHEVIAYVADGMQIPIDRIEAAHQVGIAPHDYELKVGPIRAGTVAATRWHWDAFAGDDRFFSVETNWVVADDIPGWEVADHWTINIEGKPGVHVQIGIEDVPEAGLKTRAVQYATAGPAIRAVPTVCAAPAGLIIPPVFAPFVRGR